MAETLESVFTVSRQVCWSWLYPLNINDFLNTELIHLLPDLMLQLSFRQCLTVYGFKVQN